MDLKKAIVQVLCYRVQVKNWHQMNTEYGASRSYIECLQVDTKNLQLLYNVFSILCVYRVFQQMFLRETGV